MIEDRITQQARTLGEEVAQAYPPRKMPSAVLSVLAVMVLLAFMLFVFERNDQIAERYCHQTGRVLQHGWNGRYCVDLLTGKFYRVP
jgi:hypothetical protein